MSLQPEPKTGLNPPTFGSFNIKVQVH